MRIGVRFFLVGLAAVLVLALSPAALGDGETYQLVTPNVGGWTNCPGFVVETVDRSVTGCTPFPAGVTPINTEYSAAANGSVVFMADDCTDPNTCGDNGSIWLVKPDGSSVHLDSSLWDFAPTISYDGSKVTFARFDLATWSSDIYTINSDGSDLQLAVSGGGTNDLRVPSISPDGSTIAFWCGPAVHATGAGQGCGPLTDGSYRTWGLMRVNIDGTDPRMIVIGAGDAIEPAGPSGLSWSPDGKWLAMDGALTVYVAGGQSGQSQIFEYHTDGSDLFNNADPTRQITHEPYPWPPVFPQFSPDGSQLLYMKTVEDNGNQGDFSYMINVDGTNRREVFLTPDPMTCNGTCTGQSSYGEFIPTATPVPPPPLVDMTHITVPSVHALRVRAARAHLRAQNLNVGKVTYKYSAKVHKNHVLSQRPKAGAVAHRTAKIGPSVNLVVSRGRRPRR